MTTDELKPCPFCGGEAAIKQDVSHSTAFFIGCQDWECFGNMMWDEAETAARHKWNTRTEAAEVLTLREREARLVEALREIVDPIAAMQARLLDGEVLYGLGANLLANDAGYLREIARAALSEIQEGGE